MADWELIRRNRQQVIDKKVIGANCKCFSYNYYQGNQILGIVHNPRDIEACTIENVHTNGWVIDWIDPHSVKHILIHQVKLYC